MKNGGTTLSRARRKSSLGLGGNEDATQELMVKIAPYCKELGLDGEVSCDKNG